MNACDSVTQDALAEFVANGDGIEVTPVCLDGYSANECEDADADAYSVYVHVQTGGVQWIADYSTHTHGREAAEEAAYAYAATLLAAHPQLAVYGINCANSPENKR
jgi:hypothetical protein